MQKLVQWFEKRKTDTNSKTEVMGREWRPKIGQSYVISTVFIHTHKKKTQNVLRCTKGNSPKCLVNIYIDLCNGIC